MKAPGQPHIVITSINKPNGPLRTFAEEGAKRGYQFLVIGDTKSPETFELAGCDFYSVAQQLETGLAFASACPTRHYARKNIGYLLAIQAGASVIRDTDDDNIPRAAFWELPERVQRVPHIEEHGWVNVYGWFTEAPLWPRGLPLDEIRKPLPAFDSLAERETDCPILQGLADENPDVDAIYRLVLPLPQNFRADRRVALGSGAWCPFNSQNTTWYPEAYPLLYLPAYCSFRMTDIWRSFVAQRLAWENGWSVLFHEPTVWQERNEHDLMRDFADEVPGYLHNRAICQVLAELELAPGVAHLPTNLLRCYQALVARGWIGAQELQLLEAWLTDLERITSQRGAAKLQP